MPWRAISWYLATVGAQFSGGQSWPQQQCSAIYYSVVLHSSFDNMQDTSWNEKVLIFFFLSARDLNAKIREVIRSFSRVARARDTLVNRWTLLTHADWHQTEMMLFAVCALPVKATPLVYCEVWGFLPPEVKSTIEETAEQMYPFRRCNRGCFVLQSQCPGSHSTFFGLFFFFFNLHG